MNAATKKLVLLTYVPLAFLATLFAVAYVGSEDPAYFWDSGLYWSYFKILGSLVRSDLSEFASTIFVTIAVADYNVSGLLPILPVYLVAGNERAAYVAAICAFYVVPAALVAVHLAPEEDSSLGTRWLAIFSAILMPVFWNSALRGMIDPIGLIPLGIAAIAIWNTRFLARSSWKGALLIGLVLWLPFLFRRWYAYSLVVLIGMSLVAAIFTELSSRRETAHSNLLQNGMLQVPLRWLIALFTIVLALVLFQWPLVNKILGTNYGYIYSAYQTSLQSQLATYYNNFGPIIGGFVILGLLADIGRRNWRNLFYFTVAAGTALWFSLYFEPAMQHFLPIALMIYPVFFTGVSLSWRFLTSPWRLLVPLLLLLNFANTYFPPSAGALQMVRSALGGPTYPPLKLDNYSEYVRLTDDLLSLEKDARIAVIASSTKLSGSLLGAVNDNLLPRLMKVSDVDLRDHFNWEVLNADYVVLGQPTPLHLQPTGQRVISIPSEEIASGIGVGTSFTPTGQQYELSSALVARIYRRNGPIPATELTNFKEKFYRIYPQWRNVRDVHSQP